VQQIITKKGEKAMKTQGIKAIMSQGRSGFQAKERNQILLKIHNATLKKFYETKIASLADHELPLHLLKMLCQDVPIQTIDLESKWERKWFVRKCMRFYQRKVKEIERSEKTGFFSMFIKF